MFKSIRPDIAVNMSISSGIEPLFQQQYQRIGRIDRDITRRRVYRITKISKILKWKS